MERVILFIFSLFICFQLSLAQNNSNDSTKNTYKDSIAHQCDMVDIIEKYASVHLRSDSSKYNKQSRFYSFLPAAGYSLLTGFAVTAVLNTSFYTDSNRNKFSNILLNGNYSQYHQYWFIFNTNIFFDKLKLHFFGDTRYYNFPTQTYGLGDNSTLADALSIDYSYLRCYQIMFKELTNNVFAGMGYNLDYHWNINADLVPGRALEEFERLEKGKQSVSSGISFNMLFDSRKNSVNPLCGTFAHIQYRPNLILLGSDKNWQSLQVDIRHYIKLPGSSNNVLSFWSYNNLTLAGTPPYLDMPSIGWDDYSNTGRGYVPGRYTGRNLLYFESEYRFGLTRNGLIGGVVFGNAESILKSTTSGLHDVIPGGGFGLRIKVNKYSNTNVAIDYGFGIGGSRGFFFNVGEVF